MSPGMQYKCNRGCYVGGSVVKRFERRGPFSCATKLEFEIKRFFIGRIFDPLQQSYAYRPLIGKSRLKLYKILTGVFCKFVSKNLGNRGIQS